MDDDKVALGHDQARFIFEGRGTTLDEVEEAFAARLDVGAVLDVVRRPITLGRLVMPFVEECVECFEDERLVHFRRRRHLSCSHIASVS